MIDQRPIDEKVGAVTWPLEDRIQVLEARLKQAVKVIIECKNAIVSEHPAQLSNAMRLADNFLAEGK